MWVTQKEAKGMWCPFSRVIEGDGIGGMVTGNRSEAANGEPWIGDRHMCLAENCMAWRWRRMSDMDFHGCCGLAGRPK